MKLSTLPLIVLLMLALPMVARSEQCSGTEPITFRVNRFLGYEQSAMMMRPLVQVVRLPQSISSEGVVSRRGVKVGRYLFVYRESRGQGEWERYRQNDQGGYNPFVSAENSIRVTTDESIFVKKEDGHELSIRRNSGDESLQTEIRLRLSDDKIEVIDRMGAQPRGLAQVNLGVEDVSSKNTIDIDLTKKGPITKSEINCSHPPEDGPMYIRRPREPYSEPHRSKTGMD